jgi:septum formation protein
MTLDTRNPRIYLASRSPRRRELLMQVGIRFDTIAFRNPPREDKDVDETAHPDETPLDYVQRVAQAKALHGWRIVGWRRLMPQPVLAADTTLELDGCIIGKPSDADDAIRILRRLSTKTHRVLTAVAVAFEGRLESALSVSEVRFGALDEGEIRRYVASGEPMDKAGAYGIQGHAGLFVEQLTGSYTGVMGLPLFETGALLRRFGYPL